MILILTFAIFLSYLTITTVKYGWLPSISESFYRLPTRLNWIFSIFLWAISVLLIWATWDTTLIVLAGSCIMGVGVFPYFLEEKWMHYVFALLGISLGMISLWVDFNQKALVIGFVHMNWVLS